MAVVYSPELDKAAYLMAQHMTQTMLSELHESLLPQAKSRKLVRLEGFKEIKGLSSALSSIGLTLADFRVPQGLFCNPLSVVEYRLTARDGTKWIQNERDGTLIPEIPQGMDLGALPILVSMSDQGPNIIGAANYLQYSSSALMFVALFDPFHRAWNDLKAALKRTSCQAWRCVLELTLVANLNYGPFGSSAWHWKKKAKLENYLATKGIHHDSWSAYQHHICKERRIQEPATMEDSEELFASLASMQSFENKGPLIKLMRWFSWFESMSWYEGELWATKMVLEDALEQKEEASEKEVDERPLGKQDHQQELRDLKKKKGTWRLAPELINSKNMAIKDIILAVGKATWKGFASRARDVVTPQHVLELNISCAYNAYWKQELVEMVENSLYDTKTMDHLMPEFQCHEKVLLWHTDLFNKLMETRSQSLVAFHCLPPNLYNHCLAPSIAVARAAYDLAMSHWRILLAAEEARNTGEDVKPLKSMHWRLNPLVRVLFMAFEEDLIKGTLLSIHSSALRLQRVIGQHLGDSRLIENIHQHGRDLFRASKANSISNTAIMSNALRSKVLDQKKVPMVNAEESQKATGAVLAHNSLDILVKVLASAEFGFLGLLMNVVFDSKGERCFCCSQARDSIMWHHIWDLEDWVEIEVGPCMVSEHRGPVGWKASGEILPLEVAALANGLSMTFQQAKGLLTTLAPDATLPANPSKKLVMQRLINMVVPENLLEQAMSHIQKAEDPEENMFDSDFDEILSELGQDEGNQQDLKEYKKKRQYFRMKRKMGAKDEAIPKAKAKGRPKGKAKAKAKGKAKAKAGAKEPLGSKLRRNAKKKLEETRNADMDMDVEDADMAMPEQPEAAMDVDQPPQIPVEEPPPPPPLGSPNPAEPEETIQEEAPPPAEPASSSPPAVPPPAEPASSSAAVPPQAEPSPPEPASSSARPSSAVPRAERRRSPEEILTTIEPPGCKFGVSHTDHRFTSVWKDDHPGLPGALAQKRLSRTFVTIRGWREALIQVHEHNWKKWGHLKDKYPLQEGMQEMRPGQIPESVFDQLLPHINSLPSVTRHRVACPKTGGAPRQLGGEKSWTQRSISKADQSWRWLSWKSLSFCSSFIWYCPSLHVKPGLSEMHEEAARIWIGGRDRELRHAEKVHEKERQLRDPFNQDNAARGWYQRSTTNTGKTIMTSGGGPRMQVGYGRRVNPNSNNFRGFKPKKR
eukprot:symbB.v1.2.018159.t1/scaffold1437.1/size118820/2